MRVIRSPKLARQIFSSAIWNYNTEDQAIYLTFDDGPTERTSEILELLAIYDAKATFFCVGQNVEKNRRLFEEIQASGHRIGNHSHTHCKGWKVSNQFYLDDVEKAQSLIQSDLFRPPYGKMTLTQYRALKKQYRIVMWSHLSYDFDPMMSTTEFIKLLREDFCGGEIVVLHDNLKYFNRSLEMLTEILSWTTEMGIQCKAIP